MVYYLVASIVVAIVFLFPLATNGDAPIDWSPLERAGESMSRWAAEERQFKLQEQKLELQRRQLEIERQRHEVEMQRKGIEVQKKQVELEQIRQQSGQKQQYTAGTVSQPPIGSGGHWVLLLERKDGPAYYYDSSSVISGDNGKIGVVSKQVFPDNMSTTKPKMQEIAIQMDCGRSTVQVTRIVEINKGNVRTERPTDKDTTIGIRPGSVMDILKKHVCKPEGG
jgi:hypothetical protein